MIRSTFFAALAVVAVSGSAFAFQNTSSVVVNYADLDLSRPVGVQILLSRLRAASATVCGRSDIRDLSRAAQFHACFDAAMDNAVAQTHASQVALAYGKPQLVAENRPVQTVAVASNR